jgi:hypothetical protein
MLTSGAELGPHEPFGPAERLMVGAAEVLNDRFRNLHAPRAGGRKFRAQTERTLKIYVPR